MKFARVPDGQKYDIDASEDFGTYVERLKSELDNHAHIFKHSMVMFSRMKTERDQLVKDNKEIVKILFNNAHHDIACGIWGLNIKAGCTCGLNAVRSKYQEIFDEM